MLFAKNSNAGEYLDMMLEWMGTKTFINRTAEELLFEGNFISFYFPVTISKNILRPRWFSVGKFDYNGA